MVKNQMQHVFPDQAVPFDRECDALRIPSLMAPRVKSLNGIWILCPQRTRARKAFYDPDFDPGDGMGIPVPCTVEPEVRELRLIREFELDASWLQQKNGSVFLRFDGAGPELSFWINGMFQGRFKTAPAPQTKEFDISQAVRPGVNRIAILLTRDPGDRTSHPGITGGIRLILRPNPGLLAANVRWDGTALSAAVAIRNASDRDRTLALNMKLLDREGRPSGRSVSFRNLFVKAGGQEDLRLRKQLRNSPFPPSEQAGSVLLTLTEGRAVLECRRASLDEPEQTLPLPLFSGPPANDELPFPVRGPRRDPVSLEDDGEDLWLSATNGLIACFGRTSGTVGSLELDGISLLDRGPLPDGAAMVPEDITLSRKNGNAEIETVTPGLRLCWKFLRSGMIRFTAELSPKKGKDGLIMQIPPHLDRLFQDNAKQMVSLSRRKDDGFALGPARGLVLTGDLKAGLALLFLAHAEVLLRRHRHGERCGHHHHCDCGREGLEHEEGSELLLKAKRAGTVFRFDFLLLPFASNSLRFDNLFSRN